MSVARLQKEKTLDKIKQEVGAASVILFADFRGMSVAEVTQLRRRLRQEGGSLAVYKNTLTRRALDELNIAYPSDFLVGPSAVVHTQGDAVKVTKVLVEFNKEVDALTIKGAILDKGVLNNDAVKALASLPGREELLAKLVGTIAAPISKLVTSLSSPTRGLVYALSAIKEKKQEV